VAIDKCKTAGKGANAYGQGKVLLG